MNIQHGPRHHHHPERHTVDRIAWLRAAVLGANDGLLSTGSLLVGVASSGADGRAVLLAGAAGLVAGALSMAAGEYVSVASQADLEAADLAIEARELAQDPAGEERELARIYRKRGLSEELARQVATELTAHDPLVAHARDELGLTPETRAQPVVAAISSAICFSTGAIVPLAAAWMCAGHVAAAVVPVVVVALAVLGALGAMLGGAPVMRAVVRVTVLGAGALAATILIGRLFGAVV